ncbi:MAG: DUF928 domain-containing protein [Pleurocapsa sp. MO_192.B19]|nr:DUF928 domain-containing protein [Pleurocapsa sp. MO_192.B19]
MNNLNLILILLNLLTKNRTKFVSVLLLNALIATCYLYLPVTRAIAQENSKSLIENQEEERYIKAKPEIRRQETSSIFETLWKLLRAKREQEPALSSRSSICEITPGLVGETNLIYSDRPLFLWQGTAPQVEIYLYTPFSLEIEQEVLWSQTVASNSESILYTGEPLQPGQIYDWEIVVDSATNRRRISFQVMEAEQRRRITSELAQLETELTISGANTEEITLAQANYFAERDLWSDALQKIYSIESPSADLISQIEDIKQYLCQSTNFDITDNSLN